MSGNCEALQVTSSIIKLNRVNLEIYENHTLMNF